MSQTISILAVCRSKNKGERKKPQEKGLLIKDFGLDGDAHGGDGHRQISLLAMESIEKMQAAGLDVGPGDFAENFTTVGINLCTLPIGTRLRMGKTAQVEITQIGKTCHNRCAIYEQAGDCVMPREGVFAIIHTGGEVANGDQIELITDVAS